MSKTAKASPDCDGATYKSSTHSIYVFASEIPGAKIDTDFPEKVYVSVDSGKVEISL